MCTLFSGHPSPRTFAFDGTPAVDTTRVNRISKALAVLDEHARHEYETVWRAGHGAALLA
ncbi:hypothetical protein GCM10027073_56230 [Streptomyces chlorus]|uniref:Uncharacterized protein n=1 Tax=Streptomyces chlorus TaxID=887452 RepID=A0ABW1DZH9_9ACTN